MLAQVAERLNKFEKEIDGASPDEPEGLEGVLRKMRYCLHENHYLITGGTSSTSHHFMSSWQDLILDPVVLSLPNCTRTPPSTFLMFLCSTAYLSSLLLSPVLTSFPLDLSRLPVLRPLIYLSLPSCPPRLQAAAY